MASTAEGRQATEQHRLAQLAITAAFLLELRRLWPLLDPRRLDVTAGPWLDMALQVVARWRARSASEAAGYYQRFRLAEFGGGQVRVPSLSENDLDRAARTSLAVTGPIRVKWLTGHGNTPEQAAQKALADVSGAASRQVLAGGRETLALTAQADRAAVGFARVTDGNPCAFCALLASRGFVYRSEATALFKANGVDRYHDRCGCGVEISFTRGSAAPGRAEEFLNLWTESTGGHSGPAAVRAFRRAYEAQQRAVA